MCCILSHTISCVVSSYASALIAWTSFFHPQGDNSIKACTCSKENIETLQALFFKSCLYTTSSTTFIYIVRFSWLTKSVLGSLSRKYRTEQRLCYILTIALSKGWLYLTFYRLLRPWSNIGKKISQRARNWKISEISKTEIFKY